MTIYKSDTITAYAIYLQNLPLNKNFNYNIIKLHLSYLIIKIIFEKKNFKPKFT